MILVTAATGQVGGEIARALLRCETPLRALVRDPTRAHNLSGAELVAGSFEDDAALARAFDGVDVMLLAGRDSPGAVAQHQRVLEHARRAGVRHIVKLSAIGATPDAPVALMREHHEVDEEVRAGPWTWTLVKPHLFLQNLLRAAAAVRRDGILVAPMGQVRFPLVDTRDVGDAAATVLADPAAHVEKSYDLTGPAALAYKDVAAELARMAGRTVKYEPVSPDEYEARLLAQDVPGWRAFDLAHIAATYSPDDNVPTTAIEQLLGRPPRSLAEFLDDHRHDFRG